ncbi:hypothetical protein SU69_03710 [Thermosipho melanesiensis]|nr:hypothetical protein SU68_03765 [Thermosipho melanesiensis]OOC39086.1 hypothetical protein SU69_03710 [Thermosipho melanesiensis]OOC39234.1 hypothetical protein SU70_03710 [Thermosipho melanesiensis]OOC41761.1 hypothetical protein SU71_03700 [Thermosipho melanesiensis]OOC44376.1 hypothetical protein SU72_03705 [Thermosipho melanesiensis]
MFSLVYFVFFVFVTGYFDDFFKVYKISSANVEQVMDSNGILHVHEIITFDMKKPFRGVYREVPASRAVEIENVKLWIENVEGEWVELEKDNKSFKARVWVSKTPISPEKVDKLILHVTYDAKYAIEKGKDISQVFRQFWGNEWDSTVGKLTAKFIFPKEANIVKVYVHPKVDVEKIGNSYTVSINNHPKRSFAEARFLIDNFSPKYLYRNPTLTLNEVEEIEKKYSLRHTLSLILPPISIILVILLLVLTFYYFGREKDIQYHGIYERKIPYKDTPDIVNAIVVNQLKKIDKDGISAVIMDLYKKGYLELDKEGKYIKVLEKEGDLPLTERYFYEFLKKYSTNSLFSFSELKKTLSKDKSLAKEFLGDFGAYKSTVLDEAKSRGYLSLMGTYISYVLASFSIVLAIAYFILFSSVTFKYQLFFSGVLFVLGGVVFLLDRDVFGSWSKEGREYYVKWNKFKEFLLDFSALSKYPPDSIILWEEYLVYATALGIADEVEKHMKKLVPKEISDDSIYYYPYRRFGSQFFAVSYVATSAVSSSSNGGGFSGGAGGVGGGSGGGGGGAF